MSFARSVFFHAAIFAFGAVTAIACFTSEEFGNPAFRCAPSDGDDACPDSYSCCSDDPAAQEGKLPAYRGSAPDDTYGTPLFSEMNNVLSSQGMCVQTAGVTNGLLNNCPVACNPTWSASQISDICGGASCCQTEQVDPDKDCIQDPDTGLWRALTGADILTSSTTWGSKLATNQDPTAAGCALFAGTSDINNPTFKDCLTQLNVANQRGFCTATCPCVEDLCELKNGTPPKCSAMPAG
ncbi:MAG TPA: hypothetical protein ENK31_01475 [Nannocystis exedens]|nr:hypothetical protein [Nannocystis exedens]